MTTTGVPRVVVARERTPRLRAEAEARLLGLCVVAAGAAGVASALAPLSWERIRVAEVALTPWGTGIASGGAALLGLGLILVGRGVIQRRRFALWTAVALLAGSTVAHLLQGLDLVAAGLTAAAATLLIVKRGLFVVDPGTARFTALAKVTAWLAVVDIAYGSLGLLSHASRIHPPLTFTRAIEEIGNRLIGLPGPLDIAGRFGDWFPISLSVLGAVSLSALLLTALAPVALRGGGSEPERRQLSRLLRRPDGDTLDPFILRRDKRYVFSPDRRAAVGFRYVHGVGLAAGDPVGDPASFAPAASAFVALCERMGWRPAVLAAREDRIPIYASLGLRAIYIGDEAVIDVADFTLDGRRMRNVRQSVNHTIRFGVTTEIVREGDIDLRLRRQLQRLAAEHRAGDPEYGFSMALGEQFTGRYPECVVVLARDRDARPVGFQRYVPCREGRALSLDSMRRLPGSANGVNERMIVDMVSWARERGIDVVSLNFAAFRSMMEEGVELEPVQNLSIWVIRRFDGKFGVQLDTLRRFNDKFRPRWVPRFAAYRSPADLPAIGFAAFSAEGFLPFDARSRLKPAEAPAAR
jgi:lysyl-tRNA synthetase class 2